MSDAIDETVTGPLRLAELVASLSLATDLGTGQPLEHALRTSLLSMELARRSGVASDQLADVYYLALLRFVGCTADAADTADEAGGDDIAFIGGVGPAWMGSTSEQMRAVVRATGPDEPLFRRLGMIGAMLADPRAAARSIRAHCEAGQLLSLRLGVGSGVTDSLGLAFERWDGKGLPRGVAGTDVPAPVRVVVVARDVELWTRLGGRQAAVRVVERRSGHAYDPEVASAFLDDAGGVLAAASSGDAWQAALDAEPPPRVRLHDDRLDDVLTAFGDFADLKSPWLRGHSSGVARLAGGAARVAGMASHVATDVERAGLVHDLGRVGVPNGVWDRPGPLTIDAWERVRLHPYLTERVLSRSRRLAPLARLAAGHHERVDGSGYHRAASRADLTTAQRLIAAADAYHAMTEPRPHRPAMPRESAATELRRAATTGTFDGSDVECVLEADGHVPRAVTSPPADLTERELDVLRLIARGKPNRVVAEELSISPRTVGTHVEHIYAKAGVSTRAGAALFAMEHGLL